MLQLWLVASMLALAGCATPDREIDVVPPVLAVQASGNIPLQVDNDIGSASEAATVEAQNNVVPTMERWRELVYQRTETSFIPWFTSYWTQRWLSIKLAWYKLNSEEEMPQAVKRLSIYLQEQYHDRVLDPVSREINPDEVREHAVRIYIQSLRERLQQMPQRYAVPFDRFNQRLKEIPAIVTAPPSSKTASLYQIVHTDSIAGLPAYKALMTQVRNTARKVGEEQTGNANISPAAKRVGDRLVVEIAMSGGTGVASAAFGGVAGMIFSLGAAGYGAIVHENERPQMEAQLRHYLNAAVGDMWIGLTVDPAIGVMAGVYSISEQIERSLAETRTQAIEPIEIDPIQRCCVVEPGQPGIADPRHSDQ